MSKPFWCNPPFKFTQVETTKPTEYNDMDLALKIVDRNPTFSYGELLDEVLEDFGGVQEIITCSEQDNDNWLIIALMKDWRVFRYKLVVNDFAILSRENRKIKINRECQVFEDMDDWGHWQELDGGSDDNKQAIVDKQKLEKQLEYNEKYNNALDDFFSGNTDNISKIMDAKRK